MSSDLPPIADLVVANARCVATVVAQRRELDGGWVAITDGLISDIGAGPAPRAAAVLDATDCLVTPGLVNAQHHLYQNLHQRQSNQLPPKFPGWKNTSQK